MDNEKNEISQPLDLIIRLREFVKPLGYEIYGFNGTSGKIILELSRPLTSPFNIWGRDEYGEYFKTGIRPTA
jgi:hypothetical protein